MKLGTVIAVEALPSLEAKPRRRQKRLRCSRSCWLTSIVSVSRSTGRENEKVLAETKVGTKQENKAGQGGRKVPGRAETCRRQMKSDKKLPLLLPNLKLSSVKLIQDETLIICTQSCCYTHFHSQVLWTQILGEIKL